MARQIIQQIAIAIITISALCGRTLGGPRLDAINTKVAYNSQQSPGSLMSMATGSNNPNIAPGFGTIFNVTAQTGASAYLPCRVSCNDLWKYFVDSHCQILILVYTTVARVIVDDSCIFRLKIYRVRRSETESSQKL